MGVMNGKCEICQIISTRLETIYLVHSGRESLVRNKKEVGLEVVEQNLVSVKSSSTAQEVDRELSTYYPQGHTRSHLINGLTLWQIRSAPHRIHFEWGSLYVHQLNQSQGRSDHGPYEMKGHGNEKTRNTSANKWSVYGKSDNGFWPTTGWWMLDDKYPSCSLAVLLVS